MRRKNNKKLMYVKEKNNTVSDKKVRSVDMCGEKLLHLSIAPAI